MQIELLIPPGALTFMPVLLTCRGFLDIPALSKAVSVSISFVVGVMIVYGFNLISAVPMFVGGGQDRDGTVTQIFIV